MTGRDGPRSFRAHHGAAGGGRRRPVREGTNQVQRIVMARKLLERY